MQKNLIFIVTGIICGLLAASLSYWYLKREKDSILRDAELVEVYVPVQDMLINSPLDTGLFSTKQLPRIGVHPNFVNAAEVKLERLAGQKLNFPLRAGQQLLWTDFSNDTTMQRLSYIIRKGARALALPVDVIASVNNSIRPNDHVDIIGTFVIEYQAVRTDLPPPPQSMTTITLLQNVTILAVGNTTEYIDRTMGGDQLSNPNQTAATYTNITVEVTQEEAQELVFAQHKGTLTCLLRNMEDVETFTKTPKTTLETLFKDEFRSYIQEKRNSRVEHRVEVIRGGK